MVDKMRFGDFVYGLNRSQAANLRKAINGQMNARAVENRQPDGTIKMWKTERDVLLTNTEVRDANPHATNNSEG
jgi:hypothetical protein